MKQVNVVGSRFGRLVAIERLPSPHRYRCICDCGEETIVAYGNLQQKNTLSCGCLRSETARARKTKPIQEVIAVQVWNYYQRNARTRGLIFSLSKSSFAKLIFGPCHYCGVIGGTTTKTAWSVKRGELRATVNNGVDRVDSSQGYTDENCVSACKICNLAKSSLSTEEFWHWVTRLVAFQEKVHGRIFVRDST